ncbi:MAG TPA: pectate lyase [Vicinamibacteria bacterium]|nr:pectate lyase [Vicinamibacteria bacterium]
MRALNSNAVAKYSMAGLAAAVMAAAGQGRDLGRETLAPGDGWAASGAGTTGGAPAASEQVYVVTNRAEMIAALNDGVFSSTSPANPSSEPKILYVDGTIDFNVDDDNLPLTCEDYHRSGYTREAYVAAFDPEVWGRRPTSGPLEIARAASASAQSARVRIRAGSNTTIVGIGKNATLRGVWLDIQGTATNRRRNVIIRNLTFVDTHDCFPRWDPLDGALGNWNASYDSVALREIDNVWVDHNTFTQRDFAPSTHPVYYGRRFEMQDGHLDITNASDLVTVSWNRFLNHDKVSLVGSSDNAPRDVGRLRVTLHHNLYHSLGQRTPRVRYGRVHVYNNYYKIAKPPSRGFDYGYSWGVGVQSAIFAENNFFRVNESVPLDLIIRRFNGAAIHSSGTLVNAASDHHFVDLLEEYNAVNDPALSGDVGWAPELFTEIDPTFKVPAAVESGAGPFNW